MTTLAKIGKKIVEAAEKGKDLNKVNLGKFSPTVQARRSRLAKEVKKLRKEPALKPRAKLLARHPERFEGSKRTFITDTEREKMGYPIGQRYMGPRKTTHYKKGGKISKRSGRRVKK